jgi:hypothetical protein
MSAGADEKLTVAVGIVRSLIYVSTGGGGGIGGGGDFAYAF